jgi:hypothetical protein
VAYVALANITDALNRMIAEPKSKQKNVTELHELVVLNYMMSTHIATLASFALGKKPPSPDPDYIPVVHTIISNLDQAIEKLKTTNILNTTIGLKTADEAKSLSGELTADGSNIVRELNPGSEELTSNILKTAYEIKPEVGNKSVDGMNSPVGKIETKEENKASLVNAASALITENDGSSAEEKLRQLNNRVAEMVAIRKKELEQGNSEGHLRGGLTVVKSVNDQINFIWKISEDMLKTLRA